MNYYSQHGEDVLIARMFYEKKDGFFVEVGCIDGRRFSNTLALEEVGWKGLCVEAHKGYIGLLKRNRPNSIIAHCAAGDKDEDGVVFYANERGSLSTLDATKETHFREHYGEYFKGFEEHVLPKRRLDTLFKENGIENIDLLSIDVEGSEAEALRGIDFARYKPAVVLVEADGTEDETKIDNILIPAGYKKSIRIGSNIFYLSDPAMEGPVTGRKFEAVLTHTRHPLDKGEDEKKTITVDTTGGAGAASVPASGRTSGLGGALDRLKSVAGRLLGGARRGGEVETVSRYTLVDTGFHGDRYLLDLVETVAKRCGYFIETGANVGSTLVYTARRYPLLKCLSCEPDHEAYMRAVGNIEGLANATVFNETSQEFMQRLRRDYAPLFSGESMFWLDAHGYGFSWPLMDELAFITSEFKSAYVFIDDFKVPGLDCFKYDEYEGQVCSLDFVRGTLKKGREYRVYYPNYTEVTSKHHPLCGWGLIEFGHEDWLKAPEYMRLGEVLSE